MVAINVYFLMKFLSEPDPSQIQRSVQAHPHVIALSTMQDTVEDRYDVNKLVIESLVHTIGNGDLQEINRKVNRVTGSLNHSTLVVKECLRVKNYLYLRLAKFCISIFSLQKAENLLADATDENTYVWRKLDDFRALKAEL